MQSSPSSGGVASFPAIRLCFRPHGRGSWFRPSLHPEPALVVNQEHARWSQRDASDLDDSHCWTVSEETNHTTNSAMFQRVARGLCPEMEVWDGVEPTTACLQNRCSAIELPDHFKEQQKRGLLSPLRKIDSCQPVA